MSGLLVKDLSTLNNYKKSFLITAIIITIFSFALPGSYTFISIMLIVYMTQPAIGLFTFDESSRWDIYAAALPVSRGTLVAARYLTALIPVAVIVPFSFLMGFFAGTIRREEDVLPSVLAVSVIGLFMWFFSVSVAFPVAYKKNAEKARHSMVFTYLLLFVNIMLLLKLVPSGLESIFQFFTSVSPLLVVLILLFTLLAMYGVSFMVSLKIYKNKDF